MTESESWFETRARSALLTMREHHLRVFGVAFPVFGVAFAIALARSTRE
jgi:hypothetical protein